MEPRERAISPEEARAWLLKHLASAPERDEAWYARVLTICQAPAEQSADASLMSHGGT